MSDSKQGVPNGSYEFMPRSGEYQDENHNTHWPHYLFLTLTRSQAVILIHDLASGLKDKSDWVYIPMWGQMFHADSEETEES